jgi:bacillithiol biosynthesis cysteine-adding enzyme BshC
MNPNVLPYEFVTSEKITVDYLNYASSLRQVFPRHYRKPSFREFNVDRDRIVDKLLSYNREIEAPNQVIQNIESLSHPETYAVITGQQPGVFSGPLYTVYKAISVVVLCERLSDRKHSFVPIFWNASEDHDFSEVDHIAMFRQNEPFEIYYNDESKGVAFSHIRVDKPQLKKMLTTIEVVSPNSEFKRLLLKELDEIIQSSSTIGDLFSRFMINILGGRGLVLIEPHHLRDLLTPVFERLIRKPTECTRILNEAGSKLNELDYSPKIHKTSDLCNFFILDEKGKRQRVTYDGRFRVCNETFSERELFRLLEEAPHRFSANAVTRPITQDFLFPTFAYVAGPNEIAYLAQLKGIYDFFALEMPVIFPRFGATIVENKVSKVLAKYKTEIPELRYPEKLLKRLVKEKIDEVFDSLRNEIQRSMAEMIRKVESIDKTLLRPSSLAKNRILKTIEILEDKITTKLKEQDMVTRQQIIKAHNNLFPYGDLQERRINILEYMIKFGMEFLDIVYENFLEADYCEHRVIKC